MVVVVALVGGFAPAMVAAVGGSLLLNYYFTPPLHRFTIRETNNVLALGVFVVVAVLVSSVVDLAARRTRQAARATAEAETLGTLAGSVLRGETALPALLERVREAFGLSSVTLLERRRPPRTTTVRPPAARPTSGRSWPVPAPSGANAPRTPTPRSLPVTRSCWPCAGGPLLAEDQRVLGAFAAQAAVILERHRLAEAAAAAEPLAQADRMRTALLAAVGHDLRSPLASAKAAVTSLRSSDVDWTPQDRAELLLTADESLDQLARLVDNLLDMSRLRAGALSVLSRPVALEDVVPLALDDLGPSGRQVVVDVPDDLPYVQADAGLLERVVANLVANALRYSPPATPPVVTGSSLGDRVELRVIDRGPGHPPGRPGAGLHPVPAPRRHGQHHRRRPRPGPVARPDRGDGRHADAGGDPRRRPDDGRLAAGRARPRRARRGHRARAAGAGTGPAGAHAWPALGQDRHDPGPGGRRRTADRPRAVASTCGRVTTR